MPSTSSYFTPNCITPSLLPPPLDKHFRTPITQYGKDSYTTTPTHFEPSQPSKATSNTNIPIDAVWKQQSGKGIVLRSVTTPIKNFSSHVKNQLSSFLSSHSPCHTTVHIIKLQPPVSSSGCMTINCPLHCTAQSCILSHDGPCDSPTEQMDSAMYHSSLQNPCPDLDPSSSTDSTQTHDSLITPESPHLPRVGQFWRPITYTVTSHKRRKPSSLVFTSRAVRTSYSAK